MLGRLAFLLCVFLFLGASARAQDDGTVTALSGLAANASVRIAPLLKGSTASADGLSVSVREGASPADAASWAGLAAGFLRRNLLDAGARVMPAGAPADFEAVTSVYGGPKAWALSVEVWDKRRGTLASSFNFQPPSAAAPAGKAASKPVAAAASPRGVWLVSAGAHSRLDSLGWLAGAAFRPPGERFELGLDAGTFSHSGGTNGGGPGIGRNYKIRVIYSDVRASVFQRLDRVPGVRQVVSWPLSFRGGVGCGFYQLKERVTLERGSFPSFAISQPASTSSYVRPLLEAGLLLPLGPRGEFDVRAQTLPGFPTPEFVRLGEIGVTARLAVRLPL